MSTSPTGLNHEHGDRTLPFTAHDKSNLNSMPGQLYGDAKVVIEDIEHLLHRPMKQWYMLAIIRSTQRAEFQRKLVNQNLQELATYRRKEPPLTIKIERPSGWISWWTGENYRQVLKEEENAARRRVTEIAFYHQKLHGHIQLVEQEKQLAEQNLALAEKAVDAAIRSQADGWWP